MVIKLVAGYEARDSVMDKVVELVSEMGFWGWIAVIAVAAIAGQTVIVIKKMGIKHSERMAKIANGMDPGDENAAYKKDEI